MGAAAAEGEVSPDPGHGDFRRLLDPRGTSCQKATSGTIAADNAVQDHLLSRSDYFGHGPPNLRRTSLISWKRSGATTSSRSPSSSAGRNTPPHPDHDHPAAHV